MHITCTEVLLSSRQSLDSGQSRKIQPRLREKNRQSQGEIQDKNDSNHALTTDAMTSKLPADEAKSTLGVSRGFAQQRCLKDLLQWSIQKGNTVTLTCCNLHRQSFQRSCFSPFVLTITQRFRKMGWDLQLICAVHIQYLITNNLKETIIKIKSLNSALPAYLAIHVICIHLNFNWRCFNYCVLSHR